MKRFAVYSLILLGGIFLSGCGEAIPPETSFSRTDNTAEVSSSFGESSASLSPTVVPVTSNLSEITKLQYDLYEVMPDLQATTGYAWSGIPQPPAFAEQYYPLTDGCWAYRYQSYLALNADNKCVMPVTQVVQIIYPDGSVPVTYRDVYMSGTTPLYRITMAMAFDTGDLLTCKATGIKQINGKSADFLPGWEERWVTGELLRDNRFSRISRFTPNMDARYQTGPHDPTAFYMSFALFDRTTRLTEYKYCELYASGDVFVGLYFDENGVLYTDILDETGALLRTEAGNLREEYPEEPNDFGSDGLTVMRDEESVLYYYANAAGKAVCEPTFTECTTIKNGTAVVQIGETRYMLVVTGID